MDRYPPVYDYRPEPSYADKHEPITLRPLEVYVSDGKIDKALRKLKRKLANEGVLKELKRRRRFMKPSEKRRRKQADAARRRKKRERAHDRLRG